MSTPDATPGDQRSRQDTRSFVPPCHRTNRIIPRYVALTVTLCSLICLYFGAARLQREQLKAPTDLDRIFEVGSSSWALDSREPAASCVGLVSSHFSDDELTRLELSGEVRLGKSDDLQLHLSLQADFNVFKQLEDLSGELRYGPNSVTLRTLDKPEKLLRIKWTTPENNNESDQEFPSAIYLRKREEGLFKIQFPNELKQKLLRHHQASIFFTFLSKLQLRKLAPHEITPCESQIRGSYLAEGASLNLSPSASIDPLRFWEWSISSLLFSCPLSVGQKQMSSNVIADSKLEVHS